MIGEVRLITTNAFIRGKRINRVSLRKVRTISAYAETEVVITEIPAVVSVARAEQSTLTAPASITVITRKQIDGSGASHIAEVLRGQGGVQINDLY